MANVTPTQFKVDLLTGTHNFTASTGDVFKLALISSLASYTASTSTFGSTSEVTGTGYTAGGNTLTTITATSSSTKGIVDFADSAWGPGATISGIVGAVLYNSTDSNKIVTVFDLGGPHSVTNGTLTIQFPTADSSTAILRIA